MTRERSAHRLVVFGLVLALHGLFLLLLLIRAPAPRRVAHEEPSSVLFFIETPKPTVTIAPPVQAPSVQPKPTVSADVSVSEKTSPAPAPATPPATIDWTAQASQAAAAVVDKAISEETRKCDPSAAPKSFLPPCHRKTRKFEWNPERAGFSGGLPYVRVGERCAIGLGFFGCGFGAKPPARGDLFEDMDNPERERSSVPSSDP